MKTVLMVHHSANCSSQRWFSWPFALSLSKGSDRRIDHQKVGMKPFSIKN